MSRLFVISTSLFILLEMFFTGFADAQALPSSAGAGMDSCKGKKRCVVVYMAPWCSACRKAIPLATSLRDTLNDTDNVGMQIVIGKDDKESLRDYGKSVGGEVYYDYQKDFSKKHEVTSVPVWLVFDENKKIKEQFVGSPSGAPTSDLVDHMINDKLKVAQYMKPAVKWN